MQSEKTRGSAIPYRHDTDETTITSLRPDSRDSVVRSRQIGLGLVVVVVGDEVFHRIVGKEGFEFAIQLGCQSFVVAYNESGAIRLCYYVGDGKSFPGACNSQ